MKNSAIKKIFTWGSLLAIAACSNAHLNSTEGDGSELSVNDSSIAGAVASQLNLLNQAMQLSDSGLTPGSGALRPNFKKTFELIPSAFAALGDGGCSPSDPNLTVTLTCDDVAHRATVLKEFGAGCRVDDHITVTGEKHIEWAKMGGDACQTGFSKRPDFWKAVQGTPSNTATRLASTDPDHPTTPFAPIVRTFDNGEFVNVIGYHSMLFSNYSESDGRQQVQGDWTVPASIQRLRYRDDGVTKIYDHRLTVSQSVRFLLEKVTDQAPIQTLHSGVLALAHNLAQFTVKSSLHDVKYDYNQCECFPVSGSIDIEVTDNRNGNSLGSGTVAFNYNETGECGSQTSTYQGRSIRLPSLERCR